MQLVLVDSWETECLSFSSPPNSTLTYLRFQANVPSRNDRRYQDCDDNDLYNYSEEKKKEKRLMRSILGQSQLIWVLLPASTSEKWGVVTAYDDHGSCVYLDHGHIWHNEISTFERLYNKFQDNFEILVHLKCRLYGQIIDIASLKGTKFDGNNYVCTGIINSSTFEPLKNKLITEVYLQVIADIPDESESVDVPISDMSNVAISKPEQLNEGPASRNILEEELCSDVTISTGSGTEVKAHKCFLSACSPVLRRMFENEMKESKTGKVEMPDASEKGVRAFLRYLYYGDLKEVKENIGIAFELLSAAHKYNVRSLETEMVACLVEKANQDLSVELGFKIYMFTRNIDNAVELKAKVVQFLKTKLDELECLSDYEELFKKDPKAAMKVFKDFAKPSSE